MRNEPNQSLTGTSMAVSRGPTHVSISIFLQKRNTAIACSSPWKADMRDMRIFLATVRSHRSEEHTSELQSLMRISYAVFCLKKKTNHNTTIDHNNNTLHNTSN